MDSIWGTNCNPLFLLPYQTVDIENIDTESFFFIFYFIITCLPLGIGRSSAQ